MVQPWFERAKLGVFLHWGLYSVKGITESWSFFNKEITYEDYFDQSKDFTASKYDPKEWAKLFKDAGAKYSVLTTKHHDGFSLWDTKQSDLNVVDKTPAKRDLIGPYCDALRKEDLHVGLYFSHLDWSHPDYASVVMEGAENIPYKDRDTYSYPQKEDDYDAWERFLKFHRGQLKELCDSYQPDILWFDGAWERSDRQWRMSELKDQLKSWRPGVMLSRLNEFGDYSSAEQGFPTIAPDGPWEYCMTINDSWGYQGHDKNYKSLRQIIHAFIDTISMGGNLLLGIGPREDGSIDEPFKERLLGLGNWIKKHETGVYDTIKGLPTEHFFGPTTLSPDKKTIYLYIYDVPREQIYLKGIHNKVKSIKLIDTGEYLSWQKIGGAEWTKIPAIIGIDAPKESDLNEYASIIAVELEGEVELYRGKGGIIEKN